MARRRGGRGALAGWLFADLALMLSFVFLDSSVSGRSGPPESSTTTSSTPTTIVTPSTFPGPVGADPEPIEVKISTELVNDPSSFIDALEREISVTDSPKKTATRFLVVLIRVGSQNAKSRDFAGPLSEKVRDIIKENWVKVQQDLTYYDTGDDTEVEYGLVKLKLFPVSG